MNFGPIKFDRTNAMIFIGAALTFLSSIGVIGADQAAEIEGFAGVIADNIELTAMTIITTVAMISDRFGTDNEGAS